MSTRQSSKSTNLRRKTPVYLLAFCLYALAIILFVALEFQPIVPLSYLTRDSIVVANDLNPARAPFYVGAISNIGILIWCATVSICLFTYGLIRSQCSQISDFLFLSGMFSLVLMVDDFFRLHDYVFKQFLGLAETTVYLGYMVLLILVFLKLMRLSFTGAPLLLGLASSFFGVSMLIDAHIVHVSHIHLYEDGAKFLGILSWFLYYMDFCVSTLKGILPKEQ